MVLISSKDFPKSSKINLNNQTRNLLFKKVFFNSTIDDQDYDALQCYWDTSEGYQYVFKDKKHIHFLPLILKPIETVSHLEKVGQNAKYETEVIDKLIYDPIPGQKSDPNAKISYIFAGVYLDDNFKPVLRPDDSGKSALIWFHLRRFQMQAYFELIQNVKKYIDEHKLEPLSDDPDFENNFLCYKRFIYKVSLKKKKSNIGNVLNLLNFEIVKQIKDEQVLALVKQAEGLMDEFDEQFKYIFSPRNAISEVDHFDNLSEQMKESDKNEEIPSEEEVEETMKELDLDLGL